MEQPCRALPEDFAPSDLDVICGWARQNYSHAGNRRFRAMIADRALDYRNATAKVDKSNVIISVIRRLREESPTGTGLVRTDQNTGRWMFIGDAKAKDKVGHALRKASSRRKPGHAKEAIQKKEDDVPRAVSFVQSEAESLGSSEQPLSPLPSGVVDESQGSHPPKSTHVTSNEQVEYFPQPIPNLTTDQYNQQYPPQSMWYPSYVYPPTYNGYYGYEYPPYPPPPLPFESNQPPQSHGYAPQSHHSVPEYQAPPSPAHANQQKGV